MSLTLILLLCQAGDLQVKELANREIKVFAELEEVPGRLPVVQLFRKRTTHRGTSILGKLQIDEGWVEESLTRAERGTKRLKVDLRVPQPGSYNLMIAEKTTRFGVSRTGFEGWDRDLGEMRRLSNKLILIAKEIDTEGVSKRALFERWARDLANERAKLDGFRTEFEACWDILQAGIDALRSYRMVVKYSNPKGIDFANSDDSYWVEESEKAKEVTASQQVEAIPAFISAELTLKLLDEILILLTPEKELIRLIRWPSRTAAFKAISKTCEELSASTELAELLKTVPEKEDAPEWETLRAAAVALRTKIVK